MNSPIKYTLGFLFISIVSFAQHQSPINWLTLEEADSLYKIEKKPMFIDVYTSWCGWCKKMDASTFQDPTIAAYLNQHYYAVKLDAEMQDSVTFNGKDYGNSQAVKVVELLEKYQLSIDSLVAIQENKVTEGNKQVDSLQKIIDTHSNILTVTNKLNKDYQQFTSLKEQLDTIKNKKAVPELVKENQKKIKELKKAIKAELKKLKKDSTLQTNSIRIKKKDLLSLNGFLQEKTNTLNNNSEKLNQVLLKNKNDYQELQKTISGRKRQLASFKRKSRKATHDVAIDLLRGNMSYPTFIILFDDLKANFPLKGYKKPADLLSSLVFVQEKVYLSTRNAGTYSELFKQSILPESEALPDLVKWKSFEQAINAAKKDGKKILIHITEQSSFTSLIMDRTTYRDPETAKNINKNFHAVKLSANEAREILYKDQQLKNIQGMHQLAYALMQGNVYFPTQTFLDANGDLIMRVPQFFEPGNMITLLEYIHAEGYRIGNLAEWKKSLEVQKN